MLPPTTNRIPNQPEDLMRSSLHKIRLEEREHLAHSLHDGISPLLAIARMNLEAIKLQEANHEDAADVLIQNTLALIQHTIDEVKHLTCDLKEKANLVFDLKRKLEDFCQKINDTRVLYVSLNIGMGIPIFNSKMGSELFCILKELLHNTIKHANASEVKINLSQKDGILMLIYQDNGNGYIPKTIRKQNQLGLNSIYLRMQRLNARYQVKAALGIGFRLTANIPLSFDHLK